MVMKLKKKIQLICEFQFWSSKYTLLHCTKLYSVAPEEKMANKIKIYPHFKSVYTFSYKLVKKQLIGIDWVLFEFFFWIHLALKFSEPKKLIEALRSVEKKYFWWPINANQWFSFCMENTKLCIITAFLLDPYGSIIFSLILILNN